MSEEKLNKDGLTRVWLKVWSLVKTLVGDVDVEGKGDLQSQVDNLSRNVADCFQSASDGKKLVADAVTGKGIATLATDTFATIAANIAKIKTAARLQGKSAALHTGQTSVTLKPDSGYDGLSQAAVSITLQEKTQNITSGSAVVTPDSGKVLSKITVNGPTNRGAWTGQTTGNGNVAIPAGYHNGSGYVSGAGAYNKGVSDADARTNASSANYKAGYNTGYNTGYNAGVSATKKGTAGTGDVLSGKTFTNAGSVNAGGTMANKGSTTVDSGAVEQDNTYTYLSIPANGFYNTGSKLRTLNSNLVAADDVPGVGTHTVWGTATYSSSAGMGGAVEIDLTRVSKLAVSIKRENCGSAKCTIRPGQRRALTDSLGDTIYNKTANTHEVSVSGYTGVHTITISATPTAGTAKFLAVIVAS